MLLYCIICTLHCDWSFPSRIYCTCTAKTSSRYVMLQACWVSWQRMRHLIPTEAKPHSISKRYTRLCINANHSMMLCELTRCCRAPAPAAPSAGCSAATRKPHWNAIKPSYRTDAMSQTAFSLSVLLRVFPVPFKRNSAGAPRSGRAASPAQHKHDSSSRCPPIRMKSAPGRRQLTGSRRHCDPSSKENPSRRILNPRTPASIHPRTRTQAHPDAGGSRRCWSNSHQEERSSTTHPLTARMGGWGPFCPASIRGFCGEKHYCAWILDEESVGRKSKAFKHAVWPPPPQKKPKNCSALK